MRNPKHIVTVAGDIPSHTAGFTLPHEHVFVDLTVPNFVPPASDPEVAHARVEEVDYAWLAEHWTSNIDNLQLTDAELATAELARFGAAGGGMLVDLSTEAIGRDPLLLQAVSQRTGVQIVMGSGYYTDASHSPELMRRSERELADLIITECTVGVSDSEIRAGVIGEIGCSWPITESEAHVLRAAGFAQIETGYALYVHPGRDPRAPREILEILASVNARLDRVVICHIERTVFELDDLLELLSYGCYLEYDLFGMTMPSAFFSRLGITLPSENARLLQILELQQASHGSQILLSHDIASKHRLCHFGGHGYEYLVTTIAPQMLHLGFSRDDVWRLTCDNPQHLLSVD